jgi:hypothetical protein
MRNLIDLNSPHSLVKLGEGRGWGCNLKRIIKTNPPLLSKERGQEVRFHE